MHTILLYPNGRRADGIILSASDHIMRVVVRRSGDTVELRNVDGVWTSDDGSRVEFEWLSIAGSSGLQRGVDAQTKPRTLTAGETFLPV